jgi:hypothetical protein
MFGSIWTADSGQVFAIRRQAFERVPVGSISNSFLTKEPIMGKGNNSQKNDKKSKKPKQDKKASKKDGAKK